MECRICGSNATQNDWQKGFGAFVDCEECGRYIIESNTESKFNNKWVRNALYYYVRQIAKGNVPVMLSDVSLNTNEYDVVTLEDLKNIYPKNIHERIDWILLNLVSEESDFGQQFVVSSNPIKWSAIFAINDEGHGFEDKLRSIVEILDGMNYLKIMHDYYVFTISYEGWNRINELQSNNVKSKKVFIAMWFNKSMEKERVAIKKAIRESGFLPIIIDEKEHNNQIVPEILYEIDTCEFMIADLTGGRQGVYYEAGYGLGRGKEVILTLKKGSGDSPHFDVSQTNQIRYSTPEDLFERLMKRIEATVSN